MNQDQPPESTPGELSALRARIVELEQALQAEQNQNANHARIESELRDSQLMLRAFFDNTADSIVLLDTNYRVLAHNPIAADETEYIYHRRIKPGDDMRDFVVPANTTTFEVNYRRSLQGEPNRSERIVIHPSGEKSWYQLSYMPVTNHERRVIGVALMAQNITARKQTEMALAEREAQLAGIIDSAMDAIITINAEHRIVLFNSAAERVFGYTAAQIIGESLDRLLPAQSQAMYNALIALFHETNMTRRSMAYPNTVDAIRADGTRFPIEATISQVTIGEQQFFTTILRDISERKRLEAQLLQAHKLESVGQLAGGIAHDFNNLLTAIGGAAELAQSALPAGHAAHEDLNDVQQTVQRAAAMTRRLLAFARQQELTPRIVDCNKLLRELEPLLRRLLGARVQLELQLAPALAPILADTSQLEQVVVNLAVNARDAMQLGGVVRITTLNVLIEPLPNPVGIPKQPQLHVRIVVQDSGEGIAAEVLPHIFEPFFTTKAPREGTGLGLATCYGIVAQHGGSIQVASSNSDGTTFTIDLPATNEAPVQADILSNPSALKLPTD